MHLRSFICSLVLMAAVPAAACEEYGYDNPQVYRSPNGRFALVLDRYARELKLKSSGKVLWSTDLPQGGIPSEAVVSNEGKRVVLLGSNGTCLLTANEMELAVIDERGRVMAGYNERLGRLTDLSHLQKVYDSQFAGMGRLSDFYLEKSAHLSPDGRQLWFIRADHVNPKRPSEVDFTSTTLDLQSGEILATVPEVEQFLRTEMRKVIAAKLASGQHWEVFNGISYVGCMKDSSFLPQIRKFLNDPTVTSVEHVGRGRPEKSHGLQTQAGAVLARLTGKEAVPLLMTKLREARYTPRDRDGWIDALRIAGSPPDDQTIQDLLASSDPGDRDRVLQILKETDPRRARKLALKLIDDPARQVKWEASEVLSASLTLNDVPLLLRKLDDDSLDWWALRKLVKLKPTNLKGILRDFVKRGRNPLRFEAHLELARLGDRMSQAMAVQWLENRARPTSDRTDPELVRTGLVADVLAESNPPGAKDALRKAVGIDDVNWDWDVHVRGALAQLGDLQYLPFLRETARGNLPGVPEFTVEGYRRAAAIDWLAKIRDTESIPLLQKLKTEEEYPASKAADVALEKMGVKDTSHPPQPNWTPPSGLSELPKPILPNWPLMGAAALSCGGSVLFGVRPRRR